MEQAYGMPQKPMGGPPGGGMPPGGMPPGRPMGGPMGMPPKKEGRGEVFSPDQMVEIRRIVQQELKRRK